MATRGVRTVLLCVMLTLLAAPAARADDPVVYTAGDIACGPGFTGTPTLPADCEQQATSDLIADNLQPADHVLMLGDMAYARTTTASIDAGYDPTWGRFKSQTLPVIGNHEGAVANSGDDYCDYWGSAAHCNSSGTQTDAAFYSVDIGTWHVVVLNSNCLVATRCDAASAQYRWLAADLAAHKTACTLAAWHHPRWSSGFDGPNAFMQPIWQLLYDNGADLVLSGHSHDYERFAPIDGSDTVNPDNGMRQFVVGTGGVFHTAIPAGEITGSEKLDNRTYGVLRLVLHPTSYDWEFLPTAGGSFKDSGSQDCRAVPPPAPPPPPTTTPPPPATTPPPAAGGSARARIDASRRVRLRKVLRRGVLVRVTSDKDGSVAALGLVARHVGKRLRTGRLVLAGRGTAVAGRRVTVALRATRKDARALRRAFAPRRRGHAPRRRLRITLATTVRTASGDVTTLRRGLTIVWR